MGETMSDKALASCFRMMDEAGLDAQARSLQAHIGSIASENGRLRARLARLAERGVHEAGCGVYMPSDSGCDCVLSKPV